MSAAMPAPILFIGAPRSGTTVIFEQFARHPDLAWISSYARVAPRWPWINAVRRLFDNRLYRLVGAKVQFDDQSPLGRLIPRPDEGYEFWQAHTCDAFARSYLHDVEPDTGTVMRLRAALEAVRRSQARPKLTAKLTGPGRIGYLHRALPEAVFVHIIRDGLNVVRSLLNVDFWIEGGGLSEPWWVDGLPADDVARWQRHQRDPGVLAAVQWKHIVASTRSEAHSVLRPDQYLEVFYEQFVAEPEATVKRIQSFAGLREVDVSVGALRSKPYAESWTGEYRTTLVEAMQPAYRAAGYTSDGAGRG